MSEDSRDKRSMLTAVFADGHQAEQAFHACVERGYEIGDVNIVMSEATRNELVADDSELTTEMASRKAEGGELGGPKGGGVGMLVTISAAIGAAVAVPALGLVVAGPVAVSLLAAGAAGVAASLIGLFGDWGVPKQRVDAYEKEIEAGGILIMLEARNDADVREIGEAWTALGGRHLLTRYAGD